MDDAQVLTEALKMFAQLKINFVDTLLYAYNKVRGDRTVTFDQKLSKLISVD